MSCPIGNETQQIESQAKNEEAKLDYSKYLQLDTLFSAMNLRSKVHDEHLFIIIHQAYELWFKQVIYEIDSIREIFMQPKVDESHMLKINSRLNRVNKIFTVLVDQMKILETMTPLDFMDFRNVLETSSGFQSWQFRIIENKLGVKKVNRIKHNKADYSEALNAEYRNLVELSEKEPSLFALLEKWLERTPGLEDESFDFITEFSKSCKLWFNQQRLEAEKEDEEARELLLNAIAKREEEYEKISDPAKYDVLLARCEMFLSRKAVFGALMISFYRDEVIFHQPFTMLHLLMDIDVCIMKWRNNHALLVQRMLGSNLGSGGSSGYSYLRATISDRYKAFQDFFLLSNFALPRQYIPHLHINTRKRMSSVSMDN
ncbi:tryptophan 2,3-dioxygenase isoform X1 [Hydra vulgaris]|uniref:tryptophan 2,3-dioxygenase isoform X1 n=1 Tax=Hydra vulgaris TaxID=6087 RepID=UPI001F5F8217|nr:tryptophan 2,3-dioxygenase [Hydra vulgaris]